MVQGVLSPREREVVELIASGCTNVQIAQRLGISEATVKDYVGRVLRKLQAANRSAAVAAWVRGQPGDADQSMPSEERA